MAKLYIGDSQGTPAIIKIEEVPKKKLGVSIDTFIGDVDENGTLLATTWTGALNFAGVTEIANDSLKYAFYGRLGITSVDLSSLQSVGVYGLSSAFQDCKGITSIDLSSLQSMKDYGLSSAFRGCTGITTSIDLSSLQSVGVYGLSSAFQDCKGITSIDLSSLQSVETYGLSSAFRGCTGITSISFPSLTSVYSNSFGNISVTGAFRNCTALTKIHFRADMQATIEAMSQYADKWGANNATIYFDLIGTITVNSVAYSRNEPNSIRVDGNKTFVAWKDASDNIVYTDATAEPAVDTPVYSDQGTTQVGTVSEVA